MGTGRGKAQILPAEEGISVTATPSQCSSSAKMVGSCARTLILGFAWRDRTSWPPPFAGEWPVAREVYAMSERLVLERALVVGVDPHRESLDVVGICFPEEVMLDEAFANTRAGHEALWSKAKSLAAEHDLSLVFGLEDGSNYGYSLARCLLRHGCQVKEVNPRMTNRQRDFYGQDKTNRLDALATAAIVMRAHEQLPDLAAVEEATEATQELSRYREQLVRDQTAAVNRLHGYLANQYPGYKSFFHEVHGVSALHFWASYPTAAHLQGVAPQQLADFLYDKSHHRLTRTACLQKATHILHSLDDAPLHEPDLLAQAQAAIISDLAHRLLRLRHGIEEVEAQLQKTLPATGQNLETLRGDAPLVGRNLRHDARQGIL
jgi:transposase